MLEWELLHTLRSLWGHPFAQREALVSFQNRKLTHIVGYAARNVRYYRSLFEQAGIRPEDIRTARDLAQVPITEKHHLRNSALEDVLSRHASPKRLALRITSGSSGRPFVVRRFPFEDHVMHMFTIRARRQFGLRPRDRIAFLATAIPGENREGYLTRLRQAAGIHHVTAVDCLLPDETVCRQLLALNPDTVNGYAGAIAHVAPLAEGKFCGKKLRFVTTGGESLTPLKRAAITRGFGVRVFDTFAAHECQLVAWECPHTGLYHVCDDNVIAEVIRNGRAAREGEKGELVITALHSHAMPLIRYRMGDVVERGPETCPCGQPFSIFNRIEGRVREYFSLPDGRRIHPLGVVLPIITENEPWMTQFQMTQETEMSFVLRLKVSREPAAEEMARLQKMVTTSLGVGVEFRVELVDHIPFEPSGKFKDCRSLIVPDDG
jgi:phenylacetate-CoA ligase